MRYNMRTKRKRRTSGPTPTRPQVSVLKSVSLPGWYIEYRFDLGGVIAKGLGGSFRIIPGMSTVDACERRGWLSYTIHQFGPLRVHIERRYVLTDSGRAVVGLWERGE